MGHGAIPVFVSDNPYQQLTGDGPWPKLVGQNGRAVELGNDGTEYNHGFVILKLRGHTGPAVGEFYQDSQPGKPMFSTEL